MPSIKVSVPHKLGQEEATRRLKNFIQEMREQYGSQAKNVQETWNGNTGQFSMDVMGMTLRGTLNIEPDQASMEADLPMAAMMFKGKIESQVRDKMGSLLA